MLRSYLDAFCDDGRWTMDDEDDKTNNKEAVDVDVDDDNETDDEEDLNEEDDGNVIDADEDEDQRIDEDVDVDDDDEADDEEDLNEEDDGNVIDADKDEDVNVDDEDDETDEEEVVDEEDHGSAQDEDEDVEAGEGEGTMDAASIEPSRRRRPRKTIKSPKLVPQWCSPCKKRFPSIFKYEKHLAKRRCKPFDKRCIGCYVMHLLSMLLTDVDMSGIAVWLILLEM